MGITDWDSWTTSTDELGTRAGSVATIAEFIMNTHPLNADAARVRDQFIIRNDQLGWTDKNFPSQALFDEYRNWENQFWIANKPKEERAVAAKVIRENPLDPRQTSGGVMPGDPRLQGIDRPEIENLEEQIEDAKPLFEIPTWFKTGAIVAVLGGAALGIAKMVTGLNPLAIAAKLAKKGG